MGTTMLFIPTLDLVLSKSFLCSSAHHMTYLRMLVILKREAAYSLQGCYFGALLSHCLSVHSSLWSEQQLVDFSVPFSSMLSSLLAGPCYALHPSEFILAWLPAGPSWALFYTFWHSVALLLCIWTHLGSYGDLLFTPFLVPPGPPGKKQDQVL